MTQRTYTKLRMYCNYNDYAANKVHCANTISTPKEVVGMEKAGHGQVLASAPCYSAKNVVKQVLKLAMVDWTKAFERKGT